MSIRLAPLATICALGLLGAAPASAPSVHIADFAYRPAALTVNAGERVTFVNDDEEPHTVTAVDESFDSEALDVHGRWEHTFSRAGTFRYFCRLHPFMKATITVLPATAAAP